MIVRYREDTIGLTPTSELDIVILYYILSRLEDVNLYSEVYWQDKQDIGRKSIRTSRRRIKVELRPLNVYVSEDFRSIRVTGAVLASYPEKFLKGRKLGIDIRLSDSISVNRTGDVESLVSLVESKRDRCLVVLVLGLDSYLLARLSNDMEVVSQRRYLYSKHVSESDVDRYREDVASDLEWVVKAKRREGCALIVGANIVSKRYVPQRYRPLVDILIEGDFEGDVSGLLQLVRHQKVREAFGDNPYVSKLALYAETMAKLERGEVIYGYEEVSSAVRYGTVKKLIVTTDLLSQNPDAIDMVVHGLKRRLDVTILNRGDYAYHLVGRFGGAVALF